MKLPRIIHYPQGQYPSQNEYWLMDYPESSKRFKQALTTWGWKWQRGKPGCWHTTSLTVATATARSHGVMIFEAMKG